MNSVFQHSTLGAICDRTNGKIKTGPFGSQLHQSDYSSEGTPVVMPKDIKDGSVSDDTVARISKTHVERLSQHKLKRGDIIYGRRGDIGRQALITEREEGWLCGTGCLRISIGSSLLDPVYLHYYLRDETVIKNIQNKAIGATKPNLNTDILRSIEVVFPDLDHQSRIASILKSYDDLIENNSKRIGNLESMARLLYRHYFEVPGDTGWGIVRIGDILAKTPTSAKLQKSEYQDEGNYPVIDQGKEYIAGYTNKQEAVIADMLPLTVFGDHTRAVKLVQDPFARGADGTQIVVSDILPPYYLYQTIKDLPLSNEHYARHFKLLKVTEIARPPENILSEFEAKVEPLFKLINTLTKRNRSLAKTRDLLLPRLMSGEIDV